MGTARATGVATGVAYLSVEAEPGSVEAEPGGDAAADGAAG